ncbi:MAG: response regulator [Aeromicrobium sp.]
MMNETEQMLESLAGRCAAAEAELTDLKARVAAAQALANMGDYDWNIETNTNQWSDQLYRIYGLEPQSLEMNYEEFMSRIHPDDRDRISAVHAAAYASGDTYQMIERIVRPDGEVRYLSSNGQVIVDDDGKPVRMRGTCIDITDRVVAEEAAASAREVEVWHRQALEINDTILQSLTAAIGWLEGGRADVAVVHLEQTLVAARHLVNDWLRPGRDFGPGDLVRSVPASAAGLAAPAPAPEPEPATGMLPRVVIADDSDDMRMLLRSQLEMDGRFAVVGEAGDGTTAVAVAHEQQPDLIVLDLAMPRLDGLTALPLLREAAPDARILVLSGFDPGTVGPKVLAAGASRCVEKGFGMRLPEVLSEILAGDGSAIPA